MSKKTLGTLPNLSNIFFHEEALLRALFSISQAKVRELILGNSGLVNINERLVDTFSHFSALKCIDLRNNDFLSGFEQKHISYFIQLLNRYHLKLNANFFNAPCFRDPANLKYLLENLAYETSMTLGETHLSCAQIKDVLIRKMIRNIVDELMRLVPRPVKSNFLPFKEMLLQVEEAETLVECYKTGIATMRAPKGHNFFNPGFERCFALCEELEKYLSDLSFPESDYNSSGPTKRAMP